MSDENKNLGDEAEDAMNNTNKKTENLGDKANNSSDKEKEQAKDFGDKAKEAPNEFEEDANKTFDPNNPDSGKTVAIIAHITFIGWIVAIVMNSQDKTEFGSFYIRQTLGIWIFMMVLGFVPIIGCFAGLIGLVLLILSIIGAANGKVSPTVGVGHLFQDWFKSL